MSIIITKLRVIHTRESACDISGLIETSKDGFIKISEPDETQESEYSKEKFARVRSLNIAHIVEYS